MRLASQEEQAIRVGVIPFLREICPGARIVQELVVGGCRADLAAIEPQRVVLVEIKSKKDTLKRLDRQLKEFGRACHHLIVVADEKWFQPKHRTHLNGLFRHSVWRWPQPGSDAHWYERWHISKHVAAQPEPHAEAILRLLWRAELEAECRRHRIAVSSRTPMTPMIRDMAWHLTGREIAEAVCRQLRARPFIDADPPSLPESGAA